VLQQTKEALVKEGAQGQNIKSQVESLRHLFQQEAYPYIAHSISADKLLPPEPSLRKRKSDDNMADQQKERADTKNRDRQKKKGTSTEMPG